MGKRYAALFVAIMMLMAGLPAAGAGSGKL